MPSEGKARAEYERLYSAAAWMLALEHPWSRKRGWSQERMTAWCDLARVLASDARDTSGPGDPSDPTRHLLTRRGPGDQPVPLAGAARDWWARLEGAGQFRHPGYVLLDHPEIYGDVAFEPGSCVIVTDRWVSAVARVTADLERRLAPGLPACEIAPEAGTLSVTLHEIADHLRGAITGRGPTPRPGRASWVASTPEPFATRADTSRRELLREVARRAADQIPSRERLIAAKDRSVGRKTALAAQTLRRVLAGEEDQPWRDRGTMDPGHALMAGSRDPSFRSMDEKFRRELFGESPLPRVPVEREYAEPYRPGEPLWKALVPGTVDVVAEILDEAAARLEPGRSTAMVGYDAQVFSHLCGRITDRLFGL
ncbi:MULTISPECIES: hypothetical protein [unclassified Nocardiopsis]|uniref:hypothetical protein n=1 Tax=unclassified Nocardiopsis TaxID=2649073 RepID=UPI0033C108B7